MRLSFIFFRKKMPPGNIFTGKHRLVKQVTCKDVAISRSELALEEKNMFFLRHPYLTLEQSQGHAKALGKHDKWVAEWRIKREKKFENIYIDDHLSHLKGKEAWD